MEYAHSGIQLLPDSSAYLRAYCCRAVRTPEGLAMPPEHACITGPVPDEAFKERMRLFRAWLVDTEHRAVPLSVEVFSLDEAPYHYVASTMESGQYFYGAVWQDKEGSGRTCWPGRGSSWSPG